jgi:HEPN domain-containing protein
MPPLDPDTLLVVREWIEKANADIHVAGRLAGEAAASLRIREIVGFHCQQAAEKYLEALLTGYHVEFPKTHDLQLLLALVDRIAPDLAKEMNEADWLRPFGVRIRYPSDQPEMLVGR